MAGKRALTARRQDGAATRPRQPAGAGARGWSGLLTWAARLGLRLALALVLLLGALVAWYARDLPDLAGPAGPQLAPALTVLAADGSVLVRYGDRMEPVVPLAQLPPHLIDAVIAIEDRRYFHHFGLDPLGIARALWVNLQAGRIVQGGSTITQQLIKNRYLSARQDVDRKLKEAILAVLLELRHDKETILEVYLNSVYFGAGAWGVEAAAQTYFGKSARDVTLREAALLAGLLKAPSAWSPFNNPEAASGRAGVVLDAMVEAALLTPEARADASAAGQLPERRPPPRTQARYFADWVLTEVEAILGGSGGGDLVIQTTLEPRLQAAAATRLVRLLAEEGAAAGVEQGAVVMMRADGAVTAMVGGGSHAHSPFNRATQARRQPGSAFKPVVYLAALRAGHDPEDSIEDGPINIGGWQPANYDGRFRGVVTLTQALAQSLNTPAVRLARMVGLGRIEETARRLGLSAPIGQNLSAALGTSEVTLAELTGAYATLAAGGATTIPWAVREIRAPDGEILWLRSGSPLGQAILPWHAASLTQMLEQVIEVGTGRNARLEGRRAAGKTGTSQNHRDAWFVGFTADHVAGVWLGNDDGRPMKKVTGGGLPARLWRAVMEVAHEGLPARPLGAPALAPPNPTPAVVRVSDGGALNPSELY